MSTSSKAQVTGSAAAVPLKSGKGMSGSDDGSTKYGTGGGEPPKPCATPSDPKGNDKKERPSKG